MHEEFQINYRSIKGAGGCLGLHPRKGSAAGTAETAAAADRVGGRESRDGAAASGEDARLPGAAARPGAGLCQCHGVACRCCGEEEASERATQRRSLSARPASVADLIRSLRPGPPYAALTLERRRRIEELSRSSRQRLLQSRDRMFSKFTSILQHAVEAVRPPAAHTTQIRGSLGA
ncbi:UNVERIFIED_CONTAM: hypothetical protein K2H54_044120 [Gekko kuhli]